MQLEANQLSDFVYSTYPLTIVKTNLIIIIMIHLTVSHIF